jgi:hypothetical protein
MLLLRFNNCCIRNIIINVAPTRKINGVLELKIIKLGKSGMARMKQNN